MNYSRHTEEVVHSGYQSVEASQAAEKTLELLHQALQLHQDGRLEEANALYLQTLELQPKNLDAVELLAAAALQKSHFDDSDAYRLLTALSQQQSSFLDIVALFESSATGESAPEQSLNELGAALHQLKFYKEALVRFERALQHNPVYLEAHFNRGNTLFVLERYDEALQSYSKAIELKKDYAEAYYNAGTLLFLLKRYEEALAHFDAALAIRPDYAEARTNRDYVQKELDALDAKTHHVHTAKLKAIAGTHPTSRLIDVLTFKNIFSLPGLVLLLGTFFCLSPWASPPVALLLGIVCAQLFDHPFMHLGHKVSSMLLKASVVGLGFGVNFNNAVKAGSDGFVATVVSIAFTLLLGYVFGKIFSVEKKTSYLISTGTAICGGSAIAAIAPVIDAEENEVSVAVGTIFILNAVALLIFPEIGQWLHMTQHQFGLWSAIAIHDTSSVVGAASKYGHEALLVATTVKLARSLWILPLVIASSFLFKSKIKKLKAPWFIAMFIGASLFHTYFPEFHPYTEFMVPLAKSALTVTLFMIGTGLSWTILKGVGYRPLVQGLLTWIAVSIVTLIMVMSMASF
uniref:TPR repeat n=1 Tax=Chlorobium chlorochromatii (strain CaD3) TaxID=340177 RepID=Q3AR58_CHLCH